MLKPVDLSLFHAFLDPRLTADAVIQGTLDEHLCQIQAMITEAHEKTLPEITVNALGMDRDLVSKVLEKTSPFVASIERKDTQLHIKLKSPESDVRKEIRSTTLASLCETTVAAWPLASPDENDHLAQRRHLGVLERLLAEIWRAAQEKKQSFLFQAIGYDRRLLARATLLILPPNTVSFEKVTETNMPGFIRVAIQSAAKVEDFNIILPFVQPSSRMEDADTAAVYRRSRHTSSNQQVAPATTENSSSEISPEILQLIETYVCSWLEKENKVNLAEDFNTDPLLLRHFRLGFESAMASPTVTPKEVESIQKIIRKLKTVEGALISIERFEAPHKETLESAVSAALFPPFLQAIKKGNSQIAQESASIRKEVEIRTYRIPDKFFTDKPPILNIGVEQVARSYWPHTGSQPLVHLYVDQTPIMPRPTPVNKNDAQRRNLFYKDFLTSLAQSSQAGAGFDNLLQSLEDLKDRDFNPQETKLLALLRAGSFSVWGHTDNFLRTHILKNLPKDHVIRALSNTVANIITFAFPHPQTCQVTRKALYALMGPKNTRVATFILQSDVSVTLTPPIKFEIRVSLPIFDGEGQKTFEERIALYRRIKEILPKSSD